MEILESSPERTELEAEWENMLAHQLPALPSFAQFWQELPTVFEWLYRAVEKVIPSSIPFMGLVVDETWHPPSMAQAWHTTIPLEIIRFAAANRLCVNLAYKNSYRLIEPYSLRRTRDGNLLLYAVKHNTGEPRAYRVDRIQGAEVTNESFTPRYVVELTPSGPISAPPVTRRSSSKSKSKIHSRSRRRTSNFGQKYVFKCTICGKQFTRNSYNSSLNKHKNKEGYPCFGRTGIYITTKT